jgi:hypothetical protein
MLSRILFVKYNRVNRIIFFLVLACIFSSGCNRRIKYDQNYGNLSFPLDDSIRIVLPDSIALKQVVGIQFSPFEKDVLWIKTLRGFDTVYTINVKTKNISRLDKRISHVFSDISNFVFDNSDSSCWIPGFELINYNYKNKKLTEFKTGYIVSVYNTEQRVYFVKSDTLKFIEKKSGDIKIVSETSEIKVNRLKLIKDSLLLINDGIIFNLNTFERQMIVDSLQNYLLQKNFSLIFSKTGTEIFLNDEGRLHLKDKNEFIEIPYEFQAYNKIIKEDSCLWQSTPKGILKYNLKTQMLSSYYFRFPFSIYNLQDFYIKENHVWFNPQPYAISLIDSACYSYQLSGTDVPLKLLIDDCNIYQLFSNSIVITPFSQLKRSLIRFDSRSYDFAVMQFYDFTNKCYHNSDSTVEQVITTINKVKGIFGNSKNEEILTKLGDFEKNHFYKVKFHSTQDYVAQCSNESLPLFFRYNCYETLLRKTAREGSFYDLLKYYYKFENTYSENRDLKYRRDNISIIENYLKYLDSLNKTDLAKDSIAFLKAKFLDKVCKTEWFERENGFNSDLYQNGLLRFIKQFPNSSLVDNAEFYYWNNYYRDYYSEGGPDEEWAEKIINCYERLLIKYPESDAKSDIYFEIFHLKYWSKRYSDKTILSLAKLFLLNYPNSIHKNVVVYDLENISNRKFYFQ